MALRAPRTMPLPGQVAADPTAEAIGAATPAAVAAAAVVPQPVHAIEVPRTVRAASAAGQAIVDPRVLADADVALRAPAVEVVRVGHAKPCNRSCKGESVRGSEGAPHYATARAGGCRSHSGGNRGRNAGSGGSSSGGAAAGACDRGPEDGARCVGGGAGSRSSEGTSGRGRGSEGDSR